MTKLESNSAWRLPRRHRLLAISLLALLTFILALTLERFWGKWMLSNWKKNREGQGEILDLTRLWPPPNARGKAFSNQLTLAIDQLPRGLSTYDGQLSGMVRGRAGQARRGSQEPYLPLGRSAAETNTWQALDSIMSQAHPALGSLRALMRDPAPSLGCDILAQLKSDSFPNFICVRRGSQALKTAVIHDLHKGDLGSAVENLTALSRFARVYEDDPTVVNFMIRIAIMGLSLDVFWDALQANGWTEAQLLALQQLSPDHHLVLRQMGRSLEGERVGRLYDLAWFRSHSYQEWIDRYMPLYQSFYSELPASATGGARVWREWGFHPFWKFAWADQEELIFLRTIQEQILLLRQVVQHGSWLRLDQQLTAHYQNYRAPVVAWRFYGQLPVLDELSRVDAPKFLPANYPVPMLQKAWFNTMKTLTLHQLVGAVIALRRYELRHGQAPQSLASLSPEFLNEAPHDFMDGHTLRYCQKNDGGFVLYPVGEDGKDDGGDPNPMDNNQQPQNDGLGSGRDWVWPQGSGVAVSPAS